VQTGFQTVATATVDAPSIFADPSGAPVTVSRTFNVEAPACAESSFGRQFDFLALAATVVGGETGTSLITFFYEDNPPAQSRGCPCGPNSAGAAATHNDRGDAVDTATGASTDSVTDASTGSPGIPLAVQRSYSSAATAAGPLGPGWTMPWAASLSFDQASGNITFTAENGSQYLYASNGNGAFSPPTGALSVLAEVTDSSGSVTGYTLTTPQHDVLSFAASGLMTSDVDPTGRGLTFAYDPGGTLTSVTDAAGHHAALSYSGGLLTGIGLPNGTAISYGYTGGRLTSVVTPNGASGATTTYSYNPAGLLASVVNPDGNTVLKVTYSPSGQVTELQDGTGAMTTFSYTSVNGMDETDTTDPGGGIWTDLYAGGALIETINPLQGTTLDVYGEFMAPISVTDPRGQVTTMTYDSSGNLAAETDPLGHTQSWAFDGSNNMLSATDGNGSKTAFTYNAMEEVTSITTPSGAETTYSYDAAGDLVSSVDPRGNLPGATAASFTATYAYAPAGLLASQANPAGDKVSYTYNALGFPATITNPAGHVTTYAYNGQHQLTSVTDPDGGVTTYAYDPAGNLTSRTDPDGHAWTYAYDTQGRLTKATDPLGKSVTYGYDGDGNQVTATDARGRVTTTAYDADNRPAEISYDDGTPSVSYGYDADGNATRLTDGTGTRTLAYNAGGELTSAGGFTYAYDAFGNVISRTYPDKTVVTDTYNNDEQLATVSEGSSKTTYTYDAAGNPVTAAQPDGVTQTFTYSASGRLTKISDATSTATLDSYALKLNVEGQPVSAAVTQDGKSQGATTYAYDSAGRLTTAGGTTFAYDKAGNLTSAATGSATTTYTYNAGEEVIKAVTGATSTIYKYNADGDQDAAGSNSYTWNAANQMTAADTPAGDASFSYDASGDLTSASVKGAVVKGAVWDVNNPLPVAAEDTSSSGSVTADYAYGANGLLASEKTSAGTFNPVTDWLKSVTGLVSSSGIQVSETTYSPYGTAATTSLAAGAPASSIGYAGSYAILDSGGLDNMRARDYNPATGSFTGVDAMLAVTGQPYAYASDAPDFYTDPSGQLGVDTLIAGVVGGIAGGGGVLLDDWISGKRVKWSAVGIAAAAGAAYGVGLDICGFDCGSLAAGAIGGAIQGGVTNAVTQLYGPGRFSFTDLALETGQGAVGGLVDTAFGPGGGEHVDLDAISGSVKFGGADLLQGAPGAALGRLGAAFCALLDNPSGSGLLGG
jgi:RHS repeat-associated protein